MPILVTGRETTLESLDRRLFKTGASDAAIRRLRASIRELNPDVDFEHLRPGTVLRLPKAAELKARDDGSFDETIKEGIVGLQDQLAAQLRLMADVANAGLANDADERERAAKFLGSDTAARTIDQDRNLAFARKGALDAFANDRGDTDTAQSVVKEAVASWLEELKSLDRLAP